MAVFVMPAADTLARTLLAARDTDWGDWSAEAISDAAARLGWSASPGNGGPILLDTGVRGLECEGHPARGPAAFAHLRFTAPLPEREEPPPRPSPGPPPGAPGPFGYGGGFSGGPWEPVPFPRDRGRELDAAHTRLVAALTSALGPAPWRGGPGAWLRWRNRRTTLRLSRDETAEALRMELFPTVAGEEAERAAFDGAGSLDDLPYGWCVSRPDLSLAELFLPFGPPPRNWDDFAAALPRVLTSLVQDMPLVGWVEPVLLVLGDVRSASESVEVRIGQDRLELGGLPGGARQVWLRPGREHGAAVAALILEAFATWGLRDAHRLRTRSWTSGGYMDLPGIGVRPEGTHPDDS